MSPQVEAAEYDMYEEWDQETLKQDENFEISSEARDYNN